MNKYEWIKQLSLDEMVLFITNTHRKLARQALCELAEDYQHRLRADLLSEFKSNKTSKEGTMKTIKVVIPKMETKIKFYTPDYKSTEVLVEIGKYVIDNYKEAEVHFIEGVQ